MVLHKKHRTYLAVCSALGLLSTIAMQPAFSQEKELDADGFEVIMVTANRTSSMASKTAVALTSLDTESLRNAGVTNPTNLADVTPNLSIDRNNGLQITIRGVSSSDNTEKGDPSAAFLLDGIYIARPQAQEVSFFDVSRVEVLRGPQGTLYGRNTTAGVVNVITNKPQHEFAASLDTSFASYNTMQVTGMVNLPVTDDWALRIATNIDQRDNYVESDSEDLDKFKDNRSVRISSLHNITDDLEVILRADYSQMKGKPIGASLLSNFYDWSSPTIPVGSDPKYVDRGSDQQQKLGYEFDGDITQDNDTWGLDGELNWFINERLTLNYVGSYREFTRDSTGTTMLNYNPETQQVSNARNSFSGDYEQQSHELRLAYSGEKFQSQAGLYFFEEESGINFLLYGLLAPEGSKGYIFGFPQDPTKAKSVAAFGQSTYSVTDDLRVTAGIRYTTDDKSRQGATIIHTTVDEPINFSTGDSSNSADRTFKKTTWKLGLEYDLTDRTFLYGTLPTGYKAGGFNDGCLQGDDGCNAPTVEEALYYDPETLTSYELGLKTRFPAQKVTLNANYFHYDYEDLQLSQVKEINGALFQITTNAAEADVDGIELESVWTPNSDSRFNIAATWLDAKFANYVMTETADFSGKPLSRSPKYTLTAGYNYSYELGDGGTVDFAINSRWSAEYKLLNNSIAAYFNQPAFTKTDVTLTYNAPQGDWYAQAFIKNIEDNITVSNVGTTSNLTNGTVAFSDPRLIGVRLGYQF